MSPKNPMQRKATNSFMLGMLVMLLITGTVIALLFMQLTKLNKEKKDAEASKTEALVISSEVKSGQKLEGNYKTVRVDKASVPSDATSTIPENAIAKVNLQAGTVISPSMILEESETDTNSMREQEYNMIILPNELSTGDYIDIRLKLPSGLDFIVVAKKQVTIPELGGTLSSTTIRLNMNEAETLAMDSAIVDAYIMEGSLLYATRYTEPGNQKASTVTYAVTENSKSAIEGNPNVVQQAANAIVGQWSGSVRDSIDTERKYYQENQLDNIETGLQEQVTKALEERKAYLDALAGN